jgi:hypothetical protein
VRAICASDEIAQDYNCLGVGDTCLPRATFGFAAMSRVLIPIDDGTPLKSQGGYVAVTYMLKGAIAGHDLQPVVRVGYFDPNADINLDPVPAAGTPAQVSFGNINDERIDYEVGLNYYLRGHEAKFQLAYDRQQYDNSSVKPAVDEVILAGQVWF